MVDTFTFNSVKPTISTFAANDRLVVGDESGGTYTLSFGSIGNMFSAPTPIGNTTPNTGAFTTLQVNSVDLTPASGTWTPTYQASSGSPTITYGVQEGYYRKIGDVCKLWGRINTNTFTAAGTAEMRIAGIPFAALNTPNGTGFSGVVGFTNDFVNHPSCVLIPDGGNVIRLNKRVGGSATGELNSFVIETDFSTGAADNDVIFYLEYIVAS